MGEKFYMEHDFTFHKFLECLKFGYEIEFLFCGDLFFIQTDYESYKRNASKYILYHCKNWDDNNAEIVLTGTIDEIISFPLKDKMNIKTNFNEFDLHCVL